MAYFFGDELLTPMWYNSGDSLDSHHCKVLRKSEEERPCDCSMKSQIGWTSVTVALIM